MPDMHAVKIPQGQDGFWGEGRDKGVETIQNLHNGIPLSDRLAAIALPTIGGQL
jgi:hypothetical protein